MKNPFVIGNSRLCSKIVSMIPAHRIYCEPYFVLDTLFFTKGKSHIEIMNDSNSNLVTFYRVCQDKDKFILLYDKIKRSLNFESEFKRATKILRSRSHKNDDIEVAWAVWMYFNLSKGNNSGNWDYQGSYKFQMEDLHICREYFTNLLYNRFSDVQISSREPLQVIRQIDSVHTFFYINPSLNSRSRITDSQQLTKLLDFASTINGKFILHSKDSPLLRDYIDNQGWFIEEVKESKECLVHNYLIEPLLFYI